MFRKAQTGFSIVAAIFIVVVLAALAAALLTVASLQHSSAGLDVQGVRAYQAAQAGVEWGIYRILNPDNVSDPPVVGPDPAQVPQCWGGSATVTPSGALSGFLVTVTCSRTATTELARNIGVYTIAATAAFGTLNQPNYVARELTVTVSRCKDPANTPTYSC
jgi:MSHA biogenesis protein MshP